MKLKKISGFNNLIAGSRYYLGDNLNQFSTSPGSRFIPIGIQLNTTQFYAETKELFKYSFDNREEDMIRAILSIIAKELFDIRESIPTRKGPIK